jgi:hypothetical protein
MREMHAKYATGLAPVWDQTQGLTVALRVPAKTALFPERTRCKACRSAFGGLVVLRMFCSYKCAGLPQPDLNLATAPRYCKRAARSDERGEWAFKQRFAVAEDAERFLRPGTTLYRCANCFALHIGNVSAPPRTGAPGVPAAPTGSDLFTSCVEAVLHARRADPSSAAALAAAKRDVRAVLETVTAAGRLKSPPGGR